MRCPLCRADNTEPTCRRCKADLSLLIAVEEARLYALTSAMNAAAVGDGPTTTHHAEAAQRWQADADSWRWRAVGSLLQRDFGRALACYRRTQHGSRGKKGVGLTIQDASAR